MAEFVSWVVENRVVIATVVFLAALVLSTLSVNMRFWGAATAATTSVVSSGFVLAIMLLTWMMGEGKSSAGGSDIRSLDSSASGDLQGPAVDSMDVSSNSMSVADMMAGYSLLAVVVVVTVVLAIISVLMLVVALSMFGTQSAAARIDRRAERREYRMGPRDSYVGVHGRGSHEEY